MIKKTRRVVIALFALVLAMALGACGASGMGGSSAREQDNSAPRQQPTAGGGNPQQAPADGEPMIVWTQTVRLEVQKTADSIEALREVAGRHSAEIASMRLASDDSWIYDSPAGRGTALRGWVTIKVPVAQREAFVKDVLGLGELVYQEETSDDVTQEHVDLSVRLENLRAQEARLRELVAQAANVEETLLVEKELWRIRGEIEALDAQVKYLERSAARATVTVEFTEDKPVVREWGFMDALEDGVRGAAEVLGFLITTIISLLPLAAIATILFFPIRAIVRRYRAKRPPKPAGPAPHFVRNAPPAPAPARQPRVPAPRPEVAPEGPEADVAPEAPEVKAPEKPEPDAD